MKSVLKDLFFYQVESGAWPLIDSYELGDDLVFEIDLPGIALDDLSIRVYDDLLIIEGARADVHAGAGVTYLCMERHVKTFRRIVKIPVPVNAAAGRASYVNGVVTVTFPKLKSNVITITIERA